jgi:hypothetical protein
MNAANTNFYTLTYFSSSFMIIVTGTSAFTLNWNFNFNALIGCYQQLSFTKTDISSATSQTGSNAINFSIPEFIFININKIPGNIGSSASSISNKYNFVISLY